MIAPDTPGDVTFLPIEPLLELFANDERYEQITSLAEYLGTTGRTIHNYKERGMPLFVAEQIADRIGLHPVLIWGRYYHIAAYYNENRSTYLYKIKTERNNRKQALRRLERRHASTSGS